MEFEDRQRALDFATKWHNGQKRKDGKDYITHPIAVAEIAMKLYLDTNPIIDSYAAEFLNEIYVVSLLHDVVEDTEATIRDISDIFGYRVALAITLLSRSKDQTYFEFIMNLVTQHDFLPVYVKLADLTHNMSDLNEGSLKDKYRFAYYILSHYITTD